MALVRGKDTKVEMTVRKALHAAGLRFRLHRPDLPGHPDITFPSRRAVVFVHGCFWHRHSGCPSTRTPKTRRRWWEAKFAANVERDRRARRLLRKGGWRVYVVWECQIHDRKRIGNLISSLKRIKTDGAQRAAGTIWRGRKVTMSGKTTTSATATTISMKKGKAARLT
jgi:DNA mismatch endonuclease (patch repair protein)